MDSTVDYANYVQENIDTHYHYKLDTSAVRLQ